MLMRDEIWVFALNFASNILDIKKSCTAGGFIVALSSSRISRSSIREIISARLIVRVKGYVRSAMVFRLLDKGEGVKVRLWVFFNYPH